MTANVIIQQRMRSDTEMHSQTLGRARGAPTEDREGVL